MPDVGESGSALDHRQAHYFPSDRTPPIKRRAQRGKTRRRSGCEKRAAIPYTSPNKARPPCRPPRSGGRCASRRPIDTMRPFDLKLLPSLWSGGRAVSDRYQQCRSRGQGRKADAPRTTTPPFAGSGVVPFSRLDIKSALVIVLLKGRSSVPALLQGAQRHRRLTFEIHDLDGDVRTHRARLQTPVRDSTCRCRYLFHGKESAQRGTATPCPSSGPSNACRAAGDRDARGINSHKPRRHHPHSYP